MRAEPKPAPLGEATLAKRRAAMPSGRICGLSRKAARRPGARGVAPRCVVGALLAVIASGGCATRSGDFPYQGAEFERAKDRAAQLLSEAVRIQTVNPPGDERPLAELFSQALAKGGVEARVISTPNGDSTIGRAAAWGVVRGSGARRPIVLLSHLDVVPADRTAWRGDPFAGVRDGDYVLGRGSLDAKGIAVVHLLTLLELADRDPPLERDVIFLATPDEETGGADGAGFLTREHPELLGGARYLLTEGGGILNRGSGEPALWRIGIAEKSPCWLRVVARGTPGHSSVPPLDAAVPRLIAALERVGRMESPILVVPEVARMYRALAPLAPPEDAAGYADLARHLADDPAFRHRFMTLRQQAALVTNTLTVTVLQGSERTNVLPAQAVAHIDARLVPGETCELFSWRVEEAIADPHIHTEILLSFETGSSPTDTPLYAAMESVAARSDPPANTAPSVTIGFTDAHYFRDLGMIAYGFVPRALRREDLAGVHGRDERADVGAIARAVGTLIQILEELDRLD